MNILPAGYRSGRLMRRPLRIVIVSLLAALGCATLGMGSAQAAPTLSARLARGEVPYGTAHRVAGRLVDGSTPLAGQLIVLQARRYPYTRPFAELARTTTAPDGTFSLSRSFSRNTRLRVLAPRQGTQSLQMNAYVYPAFTLAFRAVRAGVVRLTQRYTVPRGVRLDQPTIFYLARAGAKTSALRLSARTRPGSKKAGGFLSRRTVRLPSAWKGRFRYASCFLSSKRTGLGDPAATCPRRYRF